jgi:hypothetical protein
MNICQVCLAPHVALGSFEGAMFVANSRPQGWSGLQQRAAAHIYLGCLDIVLFYLLLFINSL